MRVSIIDPSNGKITGSGECDGKRYDGMYLKVYAAATLTFAASVYPEDKAEEISKALQALHAERKAADDRYMKLLYESANKFKAFTGSELK